MEDDIKARSGFNPTPIKPPPPKKKIFGLKQRTKKTQTQKEAEAKTKKIWNYYLTHRDDMSGLAFGMGPDFKEGREVGEAEIVDFYQILCFFLRLPPSPQHSGRWDRVRDMLAVSGAEDKPPVAAVTLMAAFTLQQVMARYGL